MSDELGAAPAPGPAESVQPEPAPQPQEQIEAPTPPEPKEPERLSTREAVRKAMRAKPESDDAPREAPKAETKAETETKTDAPKPAESAPQPRNEKGQFAAKEGEQPAAPAEPDKAPAKAETPAVEVPEALSRASEEAKKAWSEAPEALRKDIGERFAQLENGLAQYQHQAQALRPFAEYAQQHNIDLPVMLQRMVAANDHLKTDFSGAIRHLAQQFGHDVYDVALKILDEPAEPAQPQQPQTAAIDPEKEQMRQQLAHMQYQQDYAQTQANLNEFWAQNPDAEALMPVITEELAMMCGQAPNWVRQNKMTALKRAYDLAKVRSPQPSPQPVQQPSVRLQAAANLSTSGAPVNGSTPHTRKQPASPREAVRMAMNANGRA